MNLASLWRCMLTAALSLAAVIGPTGCDRAGPTAGPGQKQAIAEIRSRGGEIRGPDDAAVRLVWTGPTVSDDLLAHVMELTQLRYLNLSGTNVTSVGLEHLKELTGLHFLDLSGTQIDDAGLVHLQGMTELQYLWLDNTDVSDSGVNELKQELDRCVIQK